jgi:RNA polymerase sigma-70 factor, ECF subfamily
MQSLSTAAVRMNNRGVAQRIKTERVAEIFRAHADFTWRALLRLGVPRDNAEDALQEVFLIVANKLDQYQEQGAMRAWLFAIARQVAKHLVRSDARRDRKKRTFSLLQRSEDPLQAFERREAVALVNGFLASLEESQAMVFYLAEVEGMTAPEIAASLDVKLNTVYGRLYLARKRFRELARKHLKEDR